MNSAMTPAAAARIAMTRSQSFVYRHAWRQDPVTQNPASGTIDSMATT